MAHGQGRRGHFPFRFWSSSPPSQCYIPKGAHAFVFSHREGQVTFSFNPLPVLKSQKHLESYLADCYDAIAVFLCIHIVLRFRNIAAKRDVPALDRSLSSAP